MENTDNWVDIMIKGNMYKISHYRRDKITTETYCMEKESLSRPKISQPERRDLQGRDYYQERKGRNG